MELDLIERAEAELVDEPPSRTRRIGHKIFHDHFQNYKRHGIAVSNIEKIVTYRAWSHIA